MCLYRSLLFFDLEYQHSLVGEGRERDFNVAQNFQVDTRLSNPFIAQIRKISLPPKVMQGKREIISQNFIRIYSKP